MSLSRIRTLLSRTLKRHGVEKGVEAARFVAAVEQVLFKKWGEAAKTGIRVKFYRDKAIYLSCASSVLAQEVKLNEQSILAEVNEKLGGEKVERVRFGV